MFKINHLRYRGRLLIDVNDSRANLDDMNVLTEISSDWPKLASVTAGVDLPRIARAVREILLAIGEDPDREGLVDTPARVARAYRDLTSGMGDDPGEHPRQDLQRGR